MKLSDSTYQHVCSILVGVATLFRFIAFDLASFIVVSLVHSTYVRDPTAIIDNAGYYGQAIKEITGCVATLAVPAFLNYMQPKWAMALASCMFTFYIGCLFHLSTALFFLANVVLGFAYSMSYTATSTYQMQFSSRQTLTRNAATIWSIASCSLLFGGCLYIYVTSAHSEQISIAGLSDAPHSNAMNTSFATARDMDHFRYYSEDETTWLCGFLMASCGISIVLQCFHPTREVQDSISRENPSKRTSLSKQLGEICSTLAHPHVLIFIPRFLNHGLFVSLYLSVYPTSLQYSTRLASAYPMLTAYYAFRNVRRRNTGVLIAPLNRRIHDFGLRPLYYITVSVQLAAYLIMTLTVPNWSTARPTTESAVFEPDLIWVCLGFLLGFADTANVSSNSVVCSRMIPGRAAQTFSAARFCFGIAAATIFFCSPQLTMRCHAAILTTITLISARSFNFAVNKIEMTAKKEHNEAATATIQDDILL